MAIASYKHFKNFKRDKSYNKILEHVSEREGAEYLAILRRRNDGILELARDTLLKSDEIGNPRKYDYGTGSLLSPTTLRYLKVASDLKLLFGELDGRKLAEIGGGYGGSASSAMRCSIPENTMSSTCRTSQSWWPSTWKAFC